MLENGHPGGGPKILPKAVCEDLVMQSLVLKPFWRPHAKVSSIKSGWPKLQISAAKGLPATIWPKRVVSAHSHKRNSIAGPGRPKCRIWPPKGLPVTIWPKTAVSAHSHKRNSIAGPGRPKCRIWPPKGLPVTIWPKTAVSAHSHKRNSIAGPGPTKMANLNSKKVVGDSLWKRGPADVCWGPLLQL